MRFTDSSPDSKRLFFYYGTVNDCWHTENRSELLAVLILLYHSFEGRGQYKFSAFLASF